VSETYRVLISATSEDEATLIVDTLVKAKIIAGGLITSGKSRYWWENKIVEKVYFNISAFTQLSMKDNLIKQVKRIHSDKTPIIAFFKIDYGNEEFLNWVTINTHP
jgi:periplasmic divalent cation tolerance protein